jgi:hypothetical protein
MQRGSVLVHSPHKSKLPQQMLLRLAIVDFARSSKISPGESTFIQKQKAPRDTLGLSAALLLAKSAHLCGLGGWPGLRLFEPITVAGPRPILTAFPASLACKLNFECMSRC